MADLKVSLTRKDTVCIWLDFVTRDYILVVTVKGYSVCEAPFLMRKMLLLLSP